MALLFGERLLDKPELIRELIRIEKEGKAWFLGEMEKHGYRLLARNYEVHNVGELDAVIKHRIHRAYL